MSGCGRLQKALPAVVFGTTLIAVRNVGVPHTDWLVTSECSAQNITAMSVYPLTYRSETSRDAGRYTGLMARPSPDLLVEAPVLSNGLCSLAIVVQPQGLKGSRVLSSL